MGRNFGSSDHTLESDSTSDSTLSPQPPLMWSTGELLALPLRLATPRLVGPSLAQELARSDVLVLAAAEAAAATRLASMGS